jgi:hypothetical protein
MREGTLLKAKLTAITVLLLILCAGQILHAEDNSDAWAKHLATTLETAFNTHDIAAGDSTFDLDAFLDRVTKDVTAPKGFAETFRTRVKNKSLVGSIMSATSNEASFKFLRVHKVNGESWAICRLYQKGRGVNYLEWILGADAQGNPKFIDYYSLLTGERRSETMRRSFVAVVTEANLGATRDIAAGDKSVADFGHDYQTGKYAAVLDDYKALPVAFQQSKAILAMRVVAAEHLQDLQPEAYTDALTDFQNLYPKDPSLDLLSLGGLIHEKKYDEAQQAVSRLEAFTGGDAYLQSLHGDYAMQAGGDDNFAAARKYFEAAIAAEPTLKQPYYGLVTLSLKTKDFDQTAEMLDEIRAKFNVHFKDLTTVPAYAEFVKSPAYEKWKAEQN